MIYAVIGLCVVLLVAAAVIVIRRRRSGMPISIVLIRRTPTQLSEARVREVCGGSIAAPFGVEEMNPDPQTQLFLVAGESAPPLGIINCSKPYADADSLDASAERASHPTARDAIRNHSAWMSVDAMGIDSARVKKENRKKVYTLLGPPAAALMDEDVLLVLLPAENLMCAADDRTQDAMKRGNFLSLFENSDLNDGVTHVTPGDEAIERAIAEAQRRLPEFIDALELPGRASKAMFKAKFATSTEHPEFVWVGYTGMTEAGLRGKILNNPLDPSIPKKGQSVEIPLDRIVDWFYVDPAGKDHGLFVERLLR